MARYIDADALKDELELADFETDSRMFGGQTVLFEDSVFKIVDSAPTISPDEVRGVGEWIRLDAHKGMEQYKCSVCETPTYVPECMNDPMYGYCPSCGARMEVGEDTRKN